VVLSLLVCGPRPRWGSLRRSPDLLVGYEGESPLHSTPLTAVVGRLYGLEGKMDTHNCWNVTAPLTPARGRVTAGVGTQLFTGTKRFVKERSQVKQDNVHSSYEHGVCPMPSRFRYSLLGNGTHFTRSCDVIDDVTNRFAIDQFLLVVHWNWSSISCRFKTFASRSRSWHFEVSWCYRSCEIMGPKHFGVTTLTFIGHVMSSVTWPFDIRHPISYSCCIVTKNLYPALLRLAQLLQPSLAFCFSLQPMTAYRPVLDGTQSLAAS